MNELPAPDPVALAHSRRVQDAVRRAIRAGRLGFGDYMRIALYEPGLGYYMAGARKFGRGGDFVTASEVSELFGRALATQCAEVLDDLSDGALLELGAGSGKLAAQLLGALSDRTSLRYSILEPSPELAHRQRETLVAALGEAVLGRVEWLDGLPAGFRGVMIANEVVDALPVERFLKRSSTPGDAARFEVVEAAVPKPPPGAVTGPPPGSPFEDASGVAPPAVLDALARLERDLGHELPAGYASELSLLAGPWLASLAESMDAGVVLIADYGYPRREYYSEERSGGTLACYYRHRAHHDPYRLPGLEDITAHVDFTGLAEAGLDAGLELLGYNTQAAFLLANGLLDLADAARAKLEREMDRIGLANAVKTLTLPGEMGERFQFIAFGKDYDRALRGFGTQDLTHRL